VYLSQLDIKGFRSLADVSVDLGRDVSVLIGENNGGKSNIVDALRLVTDPVDGRRNLYLGGEDVFRGPGHDGLLLRATYTGPAEDLAAYQHAASPQLDRVLHELRFMPPGPAQVRGQVTWVAGNGADPTDPQPRSRDRLRHVYLPPLRDAARDLGSGAGGRIQTILATLLNGPDRVDGPDGLPVDEAGLLGYVRSWLGEVEAHPVLTAATGRISARLSRLTRGAYEQDAGLGFPATSVHALARGLRVRMADAGLVPRDIAESGMGYANMLFVATVLAQLDAATEADLTLLLVEEPEAHLHPPLQALLLDYLREAAAASRSAPRPGRWRGYLQVVITSHAPSLATSADVTDLVVVQRKPAALPPSVPAGPQPSTLTPIASQEQPPDPASDPADAGAATDVDINWARFETAVVNVAALGLPDRDRRKLNRYLTATRSAMLFAPWVALVEGIGEALILPPMAEELFAAGSLERARFVATVLVPIDGVDFVPYLRVLLTAVGGQRIGRRILVITDGDSQNPERTGAARIAEINTLVAALGATKQAAVFSAPTTLEPELLVAGNAAAVWKAWSAQQPRAWRTAKADIEGTDAARRAVTFARRFKKADLLKGDYAQDFLEAVQAGDTPLQVPLYLADALRWLTAPALGEET
jgi:putative ATP-dependent endonuclease of OLD family